MTILEAALGIESSEEMEDKEAIKHKAMIVEASSTMKTLMEEIRVLKVTKDGQSQQITDYSKVAEDQQKRINELQEKLLKSQQTNIHVVEDGPS